MEIRGKPATVGKTAGLTSTKIGPESDHIFRTSGKSGIRGLAAVKKGVGLKKRSSQ